MPPRAKASTAPRESAYVHTPEWEGLTPGDPVKVSTPFLEGKRGYRWEFRAHVLNTATGAVWIDCFGGTAGREGPGSFAVEAVSPIRKNGGSRGRRKSA